MIERRGTYYYYQNTFGLAQLLGDGSRSMLRFTVALSTILLFLAFLCRAKGALYLKHTSLKAVGFFEDVVLLGICALLLSGSLGLPLMIKAIDRLLTALPDILDLSAKTPASRQRMQSDIEGLRNFISIRTPTSRKFYWSWMFVSAILVVVAQIVTPLLRLNEGAESWALLPYALPEIYVAACVWAFFQYIIVFANFIWFIFCVIFLLFPWLARRAREGLVVVRPIAADGVGGLGSVGSLSFSTTVMASGFLLIVAPWAFLFKLDSVYLGLIFIYGIVLLAILIIPLWSVHNAMKAGKEENLKTLAWAFQQEYAKLTEHVSAATGGMVTEGAEPISKLASSAESLQRLFERAESMPTWPASKFTRYAGGFLGLYPIVTALFLLLQGGLIQSVFAYFR